MFGGQRHTEHQVADHLVVTAHTHEAGAVAILERAVDAFGGASLLEADVFSQIVASIAPGARFGFRLRVAAAPRVGIDNGHVAERAAPLRDLGRVVALQLRFFRTSESMGHHDSGDHGWR